MSDSKYHAPPSSSGQKHFDCKDVADVCQELQVSEQTY
jgi:hypothetical protein